MLESDVTLKRNPEKQASAKKIGSVRGKEPVKAVGLRIIGGKFRRRQLKYSGELSVRPMKDRVREAVFNLVGPTVAGKHAVDLFAGTGALGLEALSRGATRATFIERHYPTAAVLRENLETLGVAAAAEVHTSDTFIWWRLDAKLSELPWLVFCSPPYDLYVSRSDDLLGLLREMIERSPPSSLFVVESDLRFDFAQLPQPADWDVRSYRPAFVGLYQKPG